MAPAMIIKRTAGERHPVNSFGFVLCVKYVICFLPKKWVLAALRFACTSIALLRVSAVLS